MPSVSSDAALPPLALAIDLGTSSFRALVVDRGGRLVEGLGAQLPYRPEVTSNGGVQANATELFSLLVETLDRAMASLGEHGADIATVGVASFWHALLGIDGVGRPVTSVLYWGDTRSAPDAAALRRALPEAEVLDRTGCRFHSSYWPAKLEWLRRVWPEAAARTARWLGFAEYALGRLCGEPAQAMSISMASGCGLLDVHDLVWDEPLLTALRLSPAMLPPLVDPPTSFSLTGEWAVRWPVLANVPWFPALGDGACANVGAGAIGPSRIALTLGTSGAMRLVLPAPPGAEWHAPPRLWAYRLDRERAVLGGALSNGGNLMQWLWGLLGAAPNGSEMTAAAALEPDAHGLTLLPFVAGERSPEWHDRADGVVTGLTLATTPATLLRAAMEAVAFRFAAIYADLRPLADPDPQIVAGGAAILSSPAWLHIVADTLGAPLIALPADDEVTARGAAAMALVAAGIIPSLADLPDPAADGRAIPPNHANHERYQAAMNRQARLERQLFGRESTWEDLGAP
ncbi:MAG: gluconokinase [Thermomicrobiales bacterium]|nr:gluconokinase [Thermomicrobiales bacterium]